MNNMKELADILYKFRADEIDLITAHDEIIHLMGENETGVSDSPAHGALPLVRKSESEATSTTGLSCEAEHGTLENRIDSENNFKPSRYCKFFIDDTVCGCLYSGLCCKKL